MRRSGLPWRGPRERDRSGTARAVSTVMSPSASAAEIRFLDDATLEFYREAMALMEAGGLDFLVGGAYAFAQYTGIVRHTKDFDVFIRRGDFDLAAEIFQRAGFK